MSGVPPQLDVHPGTPTGEWAVKTTSALDNEPATTPNAVAMNPTTTELFEEKNMRPGTTADIPVPSALSTPGQEFPGAFPNKEEAKPVGSEITNTVTSTATRVVQSVNETAQAYVPAAANSIGQYLPQSVTNMMADYIPGMSNPQAPVTASENDIQHTRSMPSTELTGASAGEHVGGVGALPGSLAESSVTKLPEERTGTAIPATVAGAAVAMTETAKGTATAATETTKGAATTATETAKSAATTATETAQGAATTATNTAKDAATTATDTAKGAAATATETAKGTSENVRSTAVEAKDRALHHGPTTAVGPSSVPSRELDGAQPGDHSSGIGALPGSINESGVARLPDEGGNGITGATSAAVGTHAKNFGTVTLPSQDDSWRGDGHQVGGPGVSGGVGALPGHKDEQGVALLPDERSASETGNNFSKETSPKSTDPKVGETTHIAEVAREEGVKSSESQSQPPRVPEKKEEGKKEAKNLGGGQPIKDEHKEIQADMRHVNLQPRTHALAAKGGKWGGKAIGGDEYHRGDSVDLAEGDMYDTDYHPAQLHPLDGKYEDQSGERNKEREPAGEKEQEKPLTGAKHADSKVPSEGTDPAADNEKSKKVGFMTKMKGEAKVLLGKMEGKKGHEKVEEGQKMKTGETAQAPAH